MVKKIKKVAVIGLGYTGLPTLVAISNTGLFQTVGFDIDSKKVKKIKAGICPIEDEESREAVKKKTLKVSSLEKILKGADVFIVCVPTPIFDDYTPNYGPVESASRVVAKHLKKGCHFILESTVNPGTCEEIVIPILEEISKFKAGKDFNVGHCPERINPGDKKWNIHNINRNIGSINKRLNREAARFYRTFVNQATVNEVSCLKVAEATKIVENTFRDINIAYVNELAQSFDAMGIDLYETLKAAANKPFAFMPHWPGCGVGGHCIAVDPYYLIKRAGLSGFDHRFLKIARDVNNEMPKYTVERLAQALNEISLPVKGTRIALLGLSFKPNISDTRESPALKIKKELEKRGANLVVYDPFVKEKIGSLREALRGATAIVIATAHDQIVNKLYDLLENSSVKIIVDGRNCLNPDKIKSLGIFYKGIGR